MTALVAATLAASLVGPGVASAQESTQPPAPSVPAADGLSPRTVQGKISPRLTGVQGTVTAFVEFNQKPAIDAYAEQERSGAGRQRAREAAEQARRDTRRVADQVVGRLRGADRAARELYRTVNAVPGTVVVADAAKLRELAALPEVRAVYPMVPKTVSNSSAAQLTRAINTWQQTGHTGEGIRIGIIDDGVDYTHATFGGPGTKEAYEAIDRTKVDPSYFPTAKVVGGVDLAGDDYDASGRKGPENTIPKPDPNPISCGTHGTHVAGTAAGFGVNADGTTFTGDHTKLTPEQVSAMRIGPGTAPRALIYSIKVFGCEGSTNLTAQAMEWALDPNGDGDFSDRLDVVNMSLGSDYGAPDDPDSLFVRKLVEHGVLPVISAGNGGDLYDVGGSPGNTPEALTVASTRDSFVLRDGAEVVAPEELAGKLAGQYSQSYTGYDTLDLTASVVAVPDEGNKDGCEPFSEAARNAVAGRIVWLEWDDNDATRRCGSAGRTDNAQAAGAVAVLLPSTLEHFTAGIAGNEGIPVFQFTASGTEKVRPALENGTLQVRLAGELRTSAPTFSPEITDTPSSFTSRGVHSDIVKPDVAAPGDTIASALSGSGDGTLVISGTSMAAPHTSGIAALVRQAHPDWTPEEVKAAVMNTAGADVRTGPGGTIYGPNRVGAGRVDAQAAVNTQLLAMVADDPGVVSVSFGTVEADRRVALSKTVRVVNKSDRAAELKVSYQPATEIPGVRYETSTSVVRVPARGEARFRVTLRIDNPSALRRVIDPTVEPTQVGVPRQYLADASGRLVLTPRNGGGTALRVPVYAAPKPVSSIRANLVPGLPGKDQGLLLMLGRGVNQGQGSEAYRSLVSVAQLQGSSPQLPRCKDANAVDCLINETARGGDLRYVGAMSTAPVARAQGKPEDALLAFAVVTWGNWYNIGSNTMPFVDFDTTGDGKADFETYVTKVTDTDVLVAVTVNLNRPQPGGGFEVADIQPVNGQFGDVDTNVFDSNVILLPVTLTALGIDPTKESAPISYTVGVAGYYTGPGDTDGVIDSIDEPMVFDPLRPALWVQGGGQAALSYVAKPGTALVVKRDRGAVGADQARNLLVLHHHNASGSRVQVVNAPGAGVWPPSPRGQAVPA